MEKTNALYMTIYKYLKNNIDKNCYSLGERLPTEMELAKQFYVSRITAKRALNTLSEEGLIVRIPGKGSFTKESYLANNGVMDAKPARTIALVMGGYSSYFGLDILNGVMDTAERLSQNMILKATYSSREKESQIIEALIAEGVDGIIIQPSQGEVYSETLIKAVYMGYPIVMLDRMMRGINVPFVGVDNVLLSKTATQRLIQRNHRHIALLALANEDSSTIKERIEGFSAAFIDNEMVFNKELMLLNINERIRAAGVSPENNGEYEFIVKEIAAFLQKHEEITAIFGTEYSVSKAAYDAVRRLGKEIPQDISLVSFDVDPSYIGPHNMSHIKQPQREMGITACELLNDIIQHKSIENRTCLLPGEWVDGSSIRYL